MLMLISSSFWTGFVVVFERHKSQTLIFSMTPFIARMIQLWYGYATAMAQRWYGYGTAMVQ